MKGKNRLTRLNIFVIKTFVLALFISLTALGPGAVVEAAQQQLIITGTGLKQDVEITDWTDYHLQEQYFSTNNSYDFHKIIKVKGYNLWDVIGGDNLKTDQDYNVTFISADGFKTVKNVSDFKATYYYTDFTEGSKVPIAPMLGFYQKELISIAKDNFTPPIFWNDQELTEANADKSSPRLAYGQQNIDDMNQSKWAKEVVKIIVGEERDDDGIYKEWPTPEDVPIDKVWIIKFNLTLDESTISDAITVTNTKGDLMQIIINLESDGKSVTVKPQNNYLSGETYYLKVKNTITSTKGNSLKEQIKMKFTTM